MTPTDLPFEEIILLDFEFISKPGERPDVVCLAAHELRSGRTMSLWRDQLSERPPYRTDRGVLVVSFVASAECTCHLALGWPVPVNVLDLSPIFRNITNGRSTPAGKGLIGALRYYGLDTISLKLKDAMQKRVMRGWPFTLEERGRILRYCLSDVASLRRLLPCILADPAMVEICGNCDLGIALYHGEFSGPVSASMEHFGVPIDMEIFPQLADKQTWNAVRDDMVPTIDAAYGVYVKGPNGDWHFNLELFGQYLQREGITWPLTEQGKLSTKRKTFEAMAKGYPQLEALRQLRYARDKMRRVKLAVGRDGRNRTVLWPFKSKTSRTQPKASKWIFSPAVWLRSLIKPEPGTAVAYIDYSSMEFLVAASLSDGHCGPVNNMLDMYRSGDPYLAFAKRVGAVPLTATKESHEEARDRYKVMMLSTQYGISAEPLSMRLGVSAFEAHEMLNQHREQFAQYWRWSDDWLQHALQTGVMRTAFGWTCCTGILEFNERAIRNWPVQSCAADITRIACILAHRHGIRLLGSVHDAVLIEAPINQIDADVALMEEIMRRASRVVLNADASGTHELRVDAKIIFHPDRYTDKRGTEIWERVIELLAKHRQPVSDRPLEAAL